MTIEQLKHHVFVGVVEDNNDPKRLCRIKVRVFNVFDDIPVDDIPWATPWKDLGGESGGSPPKGKVVSVVFDEGNPYKPEYIRAEHFNVNLEKKLRSVTEEDYLSFSSLMFDHGTQIYKTESEGLRLDHEYTNINLDADGNINLNLRDNNSNVYIGSPDSNQSAILGDNFMNWMDTFIDAFLTGSHLGNLGGPNVSMPGFIAVCSQYKALRNPQFLSHRVKIVNNFSVKPQKRAYEAQMGDEWKSNKKENNLTKKELPNYVVSGPEHKVEDKEEESKKPVEEVQKEKKDPAINKTKKTEKVKKTEKPENWSERATQETIKTQDSNKFKCGKIPREFLGLSKHLQKYYKHEPYLAKDAALNWDKLMTAHDAASFPGKCTYSIQSTYRVLKRQVELRQPRKIGSGGLAAPIKWTQNVEWSEEEKKTVDLDKHPYKYKRDDTISPDTALTIVQNGSYVQYVEDDILKGHSNHGFGKAVDISWGGGGIDGTGDLETRLANFRHPMYKWFFENAWEYGWYSPKALRDNAGKDEWWHWEFWGINPDTGKGLYGKPGLTDPKAAGCHSSIPASGPKSYLSMAGPSPDVYKQPFTEADAMKIKKNGGWFTIQQKLSMGWKISAAEQAELDKKSKVKKK
jgi:hypothetical protein